MLEKIKDKITLAALMLPVYAYDPDDPKFNNTTNNSGDNTVNITTTDTNFSDLTKLTLPNILSNAINIVLVLVTVVFFFILVIGGLKWITSGGDEKKVAAARAQITNALIGLAIVFASWAILALINALFGVDIKTGFSLPQFY